MLEFIHIEHFKTLMSADFPLKSLNVFSGLNGMGKSSLIQTLLLLRQSHDRNVLWNKGLLLNGDYVQLGTGTDVLSVDSESENIRFVVKWQKFDEATVFKFDYEPHTDLLPIEFSHNKNEFESESLFNNQFRYLSADRLGPKSHHQLSDFNVRDLNSLGNHGEYTVHYIAVNGGNPLAIEALNHPNARCNNLLANIEAWMSNISPGLKIKAIAQPQFNSASLSYAFHQGNESTSDFKPQNVGFGLSYALPVVTSLLCAKQGDLLIIENPESHLHPAGQSSMGKLCALVANNGVQLVVETHSDHFLNGIRVAVKDKVISSENVGLYFLHRPTDSKIHASEVICPQLDDEGRIDVWPEGYFDEWDKQLDRLL